MLFEHAYEAINAVNPDTLVFVFPELLEALNGLTEMRRLILTGAKICLSSRGSINIPKDRVMLSPHIIWIFGFRAKTAYGSV